MSSFVMRRGWMDDPMFQSVKREPFCHRSAWAWLVEHAAFAAHTVNYRRRTVALKRGQLATSLLDMGGAWGWNTMKVSRFITVAIERCAIVTATVTGSMVITICDYEGLQTYDRSTVIPTDERPRPHRDPTVTERELGRTKELKKDSRRSASIYDLEYEAFWKVCPRREAKKPAFAAWKRARLTTSAEILLAAMERYAVSKSGSDSQYIALPASWLNQERWLDEEVTDVYKQDRPTGPPPRPEDIWPDEFSGEVGVAH